MKKVLLLCFFCIFLISCSKSTETISLQKDVGNTKEKNETELFSIDIKGAVLNPGVYQFQKGNVQDAITKAGGLLETADTNYLNLSKKLQDEMVIIIYTKEQIKNFENGNSMQLPIETCVCPEIKNDGCLEKENTVTNQKEDPEKSSEPHVISILTATKEEWMLLPGIGETKATAIIEYREKNGFQSIEDLKKVSGIGDSTFEKIKDYLTM